MKTTLSVFWKAAVLYAAALIGFAVGITVPALRVSRVMSRTAMYIRTYDFDWLIAVLLVWAILALTGLARRRSHETATATVALVLVIMIVTLFTQLGIKDTPLQ